MTTRKFNEKKANQALGDVLEAFQKNKLTVGEILVVYGNLGYALGASIEGFDEKGPSFSELNQLYYTKPTPGVALMLQGVTVTSWYQDWVKKLKEITDKEGT
jgi:hypothetical protein